MVCGALRAHGERVSEGDITSKERRYTRNGGLVRRFGYYERFSFFIDAKEGYDRYGEDSGDSNSAIWRMESLEFCFGLAFCFDLLRWSLVIHYDYSHFIHSNDCDDSDILMKVMTISDGRG